MQKEPISFICDVVPRISGCPGRSATLPLNLLLSVIAIVRFHTMYRPMRVFFTVGGALIAGGVVLGGGLGYIQLLLLAIVLSIVGFQTHLIRLMTDLVRMNWRVLRGDIVQDAADGHEMGSDGSPQLLWVYCKLTR